MGIEDLFTRTSSIYKVTKTPDGYGGSKSTWAVDTEDEPCRIVEKSGTFKLADGNEVTRSHKIFYESDVDVVAGDRIKMDDGEEHIVLHRSRKDDSEIFHHLEISTQAIVGESSLP